MDAHRTGPGEAGLGHVLGRLACGGLRVIGRLPRETSGLLVVRRLSVPAGRIVRKTARRAGIAKTVTPDTLRHAFITAAGVPLRDVQETASHADPRTTMRYDRARDSLDRHATYIVAAYIAGAAR